MWVQEHARRIREASRNLLRAALAGLPVSLDARLALAEAWRQYLLLLPPDAREREGIALLGYGVVRLVDIPRKIVEDPAFAVAIARVYSA